MPATEKKKHFKGIVQGTEHWVVTNDIKFQSNFVQRGKFIAIRHIKLTCGHAIDMRRLRKNKMPLRTHCQECATRTY